MRKTNQEITDKSAIEEILSQSKVCRIAMMDNGLPYILPFNYGYRDNTIYIHSAPEGKKIGLLKKDKRVCFEIEFKAEIARDRKACKWATLYRSIVGYGTVEIITDFEEKRNGLEVIMSHNGFKGKADFEEQQVNAVVILKLNIDSLTAKQSSNWDKYHEPSEVNIETERLLLHEISRNDLEDIHRLHSTPEVDQYNTLGIPYSVKHTEAILQPMFEGKKQKPRSLFTWKILSKETDEFLGLAGYILSNNRSKEGEIYYKLFPKYWGRGYATEVTKRLIRFGFEKLELHRVEAGVVVENVRSVRVLEKAGMTREGIKRKNLPIRGEWADSYHYAILEDDDWS